MANTDMNCSALLQAVYEARFGMEDVILYLDTHPSDQDALNYYQYVSDLRKQAMDAYEAQCGPLMFDEVRSDNYWTWVNNPWPWEGEWG